MTSIDSIPTERFLYYDLAIPGRLRLLPSGQEIVIDQETGYSLLLQWDRMHNQVINACQFSEKELPALLAIFSAWPTFAPYDVLLAGISEPGTAPTLSELEDAWATRDLERLIKPVKGLLDGCRRRLQTLGLDIHELERYGYKLACAKQGVEKGASQ